MHAMVIIDVRRLKALRKRLGLQQGEVAKMAGVAQTDLSRFEHAVEPGGLLDRVFDALTQVSDATEAQA